MKKRLVGCAAAASALMLSAPALAGATHWGNQPTHSIWGGSGSGAWGSGWGSSGGFRHGGSSGGAATAVPEPGDIILFAAGVSGLLIGRRSSRKRSGA